MYHSGGIEEDNIAQTISWEDEIFLYHDQNGNWEVLTHMLAPRSAQALSTVRLKSSSTAAVKSDNIQLLAAYLVYLTCSPSL